ncbi:HU family DNA-binding protein [Flavobacterium sp. j3]|uniref:HU family DNA-binding protein n=1 Tax=Flavobacterium aureirubrum TaxID=3133147 RepID=A0ABU9N829_9FLAO
MYDYCTKDVPLSIKSSTSFDIFVITKLFFMPVQFKMIPKQNNLVSPAEVKYYPCAVSKGSVDLNDLAKIIASRSTVSRADCYGVIIALSEVISESLSDGNIVKIDNLGTFQLRLLGTAAETNEPLGKSNIKEAKISYKPSKELKDKLKRITYSRMR